jgi:hypothetical protein
MVVAVEEQDGMTKMEQEEEVRTMHQIKETMGVMSPKMVVVVVVVMEEQEELAVVVLVRKEVVMVL